MILKNILVLKQCIKMKKNKFNIGNRIKYKGDIYKIVGLENDGYKVQVEEFSDPSDVSVWINFCEDDSIELYDGMNTYEQELKRIILDAFSNPNWEREIKNNARKLRILTNKLY